MSSFCSPVQLSSTIGCCLFCFFLIYRPSSSMLKMIPGPKPPHLLGACLLACCCMSSQTATLSSCAYDLIAGEKYEHEKKK